MSWLNKRVAGQGNQVFTETRILAALIVPILVVAFGMLYFFPHRTGELFAWPVGLP